MTKEIRKAMNRSGQSPCGMCGAKEFLIEHHISGRDIPNYNHPSNLAYICSNCHMKLHEGSAVIERWVGSTSGKVLSWHMKGEQGVVGADTMPYQIGGVK